MQSFSDKAVLALGLLAALCIAASLFNLWLLFGMLMWAVIVTALAVGLGRASRRKPILPTMAAMLLAYAALLGGIAWLHDPVRLRLLLDMPVGTALLVYGIWPIGTVWGVLYGLVFPKVVLPEDRLRRFLETYGRKQD